MEMENNSETNINFVPCLKWIKKGAANTHPVNIQLSKNELVQIINDAKEKLSNVDNQGNQNGDVEMKSENSLDEFNLEGYDQDDETQTAQALGIHSLAELPTEAEDHFSESDDSEKEDDLIKETDNLILVGHVEGDASMLEVYVYNEEEESFYVHHDILLPAFPLCIEWLNYEPQQPKGNYCAIGTMSPIIGIWDIDIMNCIEPAFKLGKSASVRKRKDAIGHKDAVLALAWNKVYEHVIASGSVDQTILLWDMETQTPSTTINAFEEKVQCLEWHKFEGQTLLAGGCDSTARVFDCRTPENHQTWSLSGEAERLLWNPLQPFMFLAGTSTGQVECFDCRKGKLWSLEAHQNEVTGLAISSQCPGLLVTASPDETVKTWDFNDDNIPRLINEKEFGIGSIHCLELCPDSPFVISMGGDKKSNNFTVFDLQNIDPVKHTFGSKDLIQLVPEESTNDM
ncbi:periodic tryptophan protein 1 homolog [Sitophilus oryzae]|uniref:Periodic tryptophan protein 1 homolog n=1 Tax=Sitophilus oryzae TaxID=7048 RepID=A0A6J2X3N3_SITOR|nr:periodic tryptophan protein 1 homolog [Sitophilus oryzae]